MPPQSVEIAETVAALKRAVRREKEAPSDQPISSATNRGNKLKRGASFVHAGSMPYRYSPNGYKEKIEHGGFTRYILDRNPRRYNEYGDELEDSESDEEADADAEDENPYSDIRLEELLRPLTHPAELEHHPTLSHPYLDSALPDMVQNTEEKLRQERANLWRAKNLHRQFIGDESWIPCEKVEASDDWDLFEPFTQGTAKQSPSKKRKRDTYIEMAQNGIQRHDHVTGTANWSDEQTDVTMTNGDDVTQDGEVDHPTHLEQETAGGNIATTASTGYDKIAGVTHDAEIKENEDIKSNGIDTKQDTAMESAILSESATQPQPLQPPDPHPEPADIAQDTKSHSGTEEGESPVPPPRRITRALAANTNGSNSHTSALSPTMSTTSTISTSLLNPDPLFLLPPSLQTAHSTHPSTLPLCVAHSGLPIEEILETRRLLGLYIQKQEETIRGLEGVLGKLIKAKRMKERLWEWCKSEAHVGEWSDGEDWIDCRAWGVEAGELRKGRDEEEAGHVEVEEGVGARKGKRRRGGRE